MKPGFWKSFGPGLLWAAAAIGASHLVQSTRAGAMAGMALWWIILLALILKYPFFEYGPRYAAATGESLVEGYRRSGRWAVWVFLLLTVTIALAVQTAVVMFTAFLFQYVFGLDWPVAGVAAAVVMLCIAMLAIGRFRLLDLSIKLILALLGISTLIAAVATVPRIDPATLAPWPVVEAEAVAFPFLLALVGWMPSGFSLSVWSSLWTLAKNRDSGTQASLHHALVDFRIGYVGTSLLAFAFVVLGAGVMHGSGEALSPQGTVFSVQLIDLYVRTLGGWTRTVVLVAVMTTMFSTALTVIDGFPRALARSFRALASKGESPAATSPLADSSSEVSQATAKSMGSTATESAAVETTGEIRFYWGAMAVLGGLTVVVISRFMGSFTTMLDFATTMSFLAAPVLGWLNLRAVRAAHVPVAHRPGPVLVAISYAGLVLLGGTTLVYLVSLVR